MVVVVVVTEVAPHGGRTRGSSGSEAEVESRERKQKGKWIAIA